MKLCEEKFQPFPKIARLYREVIITEKIDGTNGLVYINDAGELFAGSKNCWLTPENDNFGFARWVEAHREELLTLGPGRHHGEWWGSGIQRGYGLPQGEKRWSLFNTILWVPAGQEPQPIPCADPRLEKMQKVLPPCCGLVPVLHRGKFCTRDPDTCLYILRTTGSRAAPGFMNPEGIVVYHTAGHTMLKATIENDAEPKGRTK